MICDEKLIKNYRQGDKSALDELLLRYKSKVLAIARRFFLSHTETEDLVQEGMCGLYSAINTYNHTNGAVFSTYAHTCIRNRIVDVVKREQGNKNFALNNSLPIVEVGEEICSLDESPEEELIKKENSREFLHKISKHLSSFEFKVIVMYMGGSTMAEIALSLEKTVKSVDNALTRSKNKLQKLFA